MKNYLTLVLAVMLVSTSAHASRARLEALGESKLGSYYIQDSRDIFLNPATIVHYKKKLMLEFGTEPTGTDSVANPRGQGGFTNTFGDFTYGLYLNQTSERALTEIAAANGLGGSFINPENQIEFTFAGEGSIAWGISILHAGNENRSSTGLDKTSTIFGVRAGIEAGSLAVFSTVGISSDAVVKDATASTPNDEAKGKVSVDVAATYKMDDMTSYAKFSTYGTDLTLATYNSGNVVQNRNTAFGIGSGWKHEMTKSTTMFCRVSADYLKTTTTTLSDVKQWNIPIVLAAESMATSWLTIRGSVAESLLGQTVGSTTAGSSYRDSLGGTTTVAAGVGLTFGDVNVDGLVATSGSSAGGSNTVGFGTGTQTDNSFGFGNSMLARVGMTYNF